MAITEFSPGRIRREVAYLGDAPPDEAMRLFEQMGFRVSAFTPEFLTLPGRLGALDSIILSQRADKPAAIFHELESLGAPLLNHDCRLYVRVSPRVDLQERARVIIVNALTTLQLPVASLEPQERDARGEFIEREGVTLAPFVSICDVTRGWQQIVQLIADNPAGRAPNGDLVIDAFDRHGATIAFSQERTLLLRRAFWDCAEVHLVQMQDGLSGVPAFRAYAQLSEGLQGRWPFVHFVKIGSRRKIAAEYRRYQENALMYIPYHLGPRLNLSRCGLGACEGILVGDFVDEAESLRDCARNGRAVPAIANLFNKTLRAWHHACGRDETRTLPEFLIDRFPNVIPTHRAPLIADLVPSIDLSQLRARFLEFQSKPVLIGAIHGDLHATNVLVRGADAIIIDFEQVTRGPVLYDLASLEGGLLVEGFAEEVRPAKEWLASITPLYEREALFEVVPPGHPTALSAWFYGCTRQIRLYARELECAPGQYAAVLALALLRKGYNEHVVSGGQERSRAVAGALAQKILTASWFSSP